VKDINGQVESRLVTGFAAILVWVEAFVVGSGFVYEPIPTETAGSVM